MQFIESEGGSNNVDYEGMPELLERIPQRRERSWSLGDMRPREVR